MHHRVKYKTKYMYFPWENIGEKSLIVNWEFLDTKNIIHKKTNKQNNLGLPWQETKILHATWNSQKKIKGTKKPDKLDLIKTKNLCSPKDSYKNEVKSHRLGENICKLYVWQRTCIQKVNKELSKLNGERQTARLSI